ncbi:glycoside hydrolase domain-containing protein [Kitasatospora sp. NPDC002227]|uniref:glycoside hydrolase domain-containing protein n=1 Tax=Kitasatospora sp. NPDC002227 TaxID=3154773 RepID=UPI0033194575
MRYLGPAALATATLVLLLATDPLSQVTEAPAGPARRVELAGAVRPAPQPPPTVLPDSRRKRDALPSKVFTGPGFDACSAPELSTMRAWRDASPYRAVGIYVSGGQRACDQRRLTPDWVRQVRGMGWQLLPTHVGRQAPCSALPHKPDRIDPAHAVDQGRAEAADAARAVRALGLGQGTPVYLDIETYPGGDAACTRAVVDFALGWTQALHESGYHSGFYSSADSGIRDLSAAARAGNSPMPDVVWYARWDDRASTDGTGALGADQWVYHQRVHQHHGDVRETYGGATLAVDRDQLDGLVAP